MQINRFIQKQQPPQQQSKKQIKVEDKITDEQKAILLKVYGMFRTPEEGGTIDHPTIKVGDKATPVSIAPMSWVFKAALEATLSEIFANMQQYWTVPHGKTNKELNLDLVDTIVRRYLETIQQVIVSIAIIKGEFEQDLINDLKK